jgi:hypothetical protein
MVWPSPSTQSRRSQADGTTHTPPPPKQAAAYNRHFLIRFAHEMNGDWYPQSVGQSGGTPDDYVAAYRRVRRIFDDSGRRKPLWITEGGCK